jgi:hypothetical protein
MVSSVRAIAKSARISSKLQPFTTSQNTASSRSSFARPISCSCVSSVPPAPARVMRATS